MPNRDQSILLADENDARRAFLTSNLEADGYRVKAADDHTKAMALLSVDQPDLIIADINGETLELLDAVRSGNGLAGHVEPVPGLAGHVDPDTPMIVLSDRPDDIHRIRVLERGGDDIIARPFSYPELRARVGAVLCRAERSRHPRQLRVASLTIDLTARHVRLGDDPIELSAKEYELLVALATDPHRVFTREELLRNVCGYRTPSRTVDSHACRLRQKLSAHTDRLIINVWGVGYRLCDPAASRHPIATRQLR